MKIGSSGRLYATAATYYPNGTLNTFSYGNGIEYSALINSRLLPSEIKEQKRGNDAVLGYSYSYDNNNNVTSITDDTNNYYPISELRYDGLDRLISTTGANGIGNSTISYDVLGNILTKSNSANGNETNLIYEYDLNNNRLTGLTGVGSEGYDFSNNNTYDSRGNVTNNGKRIFTYNLANQLVSSMPSVKFLPLPFPVLNLTLGDVSDFSPPENIYDGYNRRVKETNSNYSMYSQSGKLLYRETDSGAINYIYLGSKLVAKDGAGVEDHANSRQHYKPFGASLEGEKDDIGYTGHKFDTNLGLSYMQARYYDPVIGRFYSNDPVEYLGHMQIGNSVHGFGRYTYANNNPYKYVDPDGELGMLATGFIGGLIGGGVELGKQLYAGGDIDLGKIGVEAGKGALVGLGVGAVGGYMAALTEGVVTSTVAKGGAELLGKTTGAMIGSLTGDIAHDALGGDVSGSEQVANMVGNMIAPGSGDLAATAVKALVKSEVISAGTREVSATVTSEVVKDKLKEN